MRTAQRESNATGVRSSQFTSTSRTAGSLVLLWYLNAPVTELRSYAYT